MMTKALEFKTTMGDQPARTALLGHIQKKGWVLEKGYIVRAVGGGIKWTVSNLHPKSNLFTVGIYHDSSEDTTSRVVTVRQ